jgi:hypothetical protein
VGDDAVVEDGIALVENVHVITDLYLEGTLDDHVEFLAVVGVQLDGSVLLFGEIGEFYEEGLRQLFLEFGSQVVILNAVLL